MSYPDSEGLAPVVVATVALVVIAFSSLSFIAGRATGFGQGVEMMRLSAVRAGAAEYGTGEDGEPVWQWSVDEPTED